MASATKARFRVGFDLGGTKMLAAVFDDSFKIRAACRRKTKGSKGAQAGLARVIETIEAALQEAGVHGRRLAGIGVGAAGPLDLDRGMILSSPNLGWTDVPLKARLEKHFGCPAVVANDVDAGTFGEYRFGAGRNARCLLGVFPGTGIGGACVYEGRILRGKTTSCMEIGHMIVAPAGARCGCGRRGCLETVASRLAIAAEVALAATRGDAPHALALAGADIRELRSSVIAQAIRAGDRIVEDIVRHAARHLGVAVANTINLLAPDMVVLGGGLVEEMPDLYLEEVRTTARSLAMPSLGGGARFAVAKLGDNATAMGAAALAAPEGA